MKRIRSLITLVISSLIIISCSQRGNLEALIVTGQNNHNWQRSHLYLKYILEKSDLFDVDIKVSPATGKDMSSLIIDFSPYDLVVLDYTGDAWPEETKNNFMDYVKNGGGVVVYHAANNAFPDWPGYNEIIGLGGWGNRNEKSGPYVYIENGNVVRDNSPGRGGSHGQQHEFVVETFNPENPVMKGLPKKWLHTKDELYSELRGPAKDIEILAYAHADKKFNGTGKNEPVLMTIAFGKGRIFHTALGHAGTDVFAPAMECAGFITTLQRGAEWAATGKVTQKIPVNFPSETQSLRWEFFEDIKDIPAIVEQMQQYEIGQSNECFNILKKLIADNINNTKNLNEYHQIILQLLKSNEATDDCKKILCKEFSWMADESYREVYETLKQNPNLADEATYALDTIKK